MKLRVERPEAPDVNEEAFCKLLSLREEVTDEQIAAFLEQAKPVIYQDGRLQLAGECDPRTYAYTWAPRGGEVTARVVVGKQLTLHSHGHPALFKPSIEEVIMMTSKDMLNKARWFTTFGPRDASDLARQQAAVDRCWHVGVTVFYA